MTTTLAQPIPTPESARARGSRPARRTVSEGGLLTVVLAGTAAVLGLWWHDTTILAGLGEWLTSAGRLTGLLGGYAVAVVAAVDEPGAVDRARSRR